MKKFLYYSVLVFITVFAAIVFFVTLYRALFVSSDSGFLPPQNGTHKTLVTPETAPARLFIPALSIDASIEAVGVTEKGAIGTPSNFTNVAWYEYSPLPGSPGTAIIDGHRDNALDLYGVFAHLDALEPGDDVYTINASGTRAHFVVTKKLVLPSGSADTGDIFASSDTAHLVLITCTGVWNASQKTYSDRILVFAILQ